MSPILKNSMNREIYKQQLIEEIMEKWLKKNKNYNIEKEGLKKIH